MNYFETEPVLSGSTDEMYLCPADHGQAKGKQLEPLDVETDRRVVMRRLVGPLIGAMTIRSIEEVNINSDLYEASAEKLANLWEEYERLPTEGSYGVFRESLVYATQELLADNNEACQNESNIFGKISPLQGLLLNKFTYQQNPKNIITEATETQINAVMNVALVIDAENKIISDPEGDTIAYILQNGIGFTKRLFRDEELLPFLEKLAMTAQGLHNNFRNLGVLYNGHTLPVIDNINGDANTNCPALVIYAGPTADGGLSINKKTAQYIFNYLIHKNKIDENNPPSPNATFPGPSRGCPVFKNDTPRVRRDDFTEKQWEAMMSEPNPIVSYDESSNKLTMLRSPAGELNHFIAELLAAAEAERG